jgi:hypothetical protein
MCTQMSLVCCHDKTWEFSCSYVFLRIFFFPDGRLYYATMFNDELGWIVTFRGKKLLVRAEFEEIYITAVVHSF